MDSKTEVERFLELRVWLRSGHARQLREDAGLTRPMIAEELQVTKQSVMNWELGKCLPQRAQAYRYHRLLERLAAHTSN